MLELFGGFTLKVTSLRCSGCGKIELINLDADNDKKSERERLADEGVFRLLLEVNKFAEYTCWECAMKRVSKK